MKTRNQKSEIVKPRIVAFEVTCRCRFSCRHCRAEAGIGDKEKELTTEQCKKILASVADFTGCSGVKTRKRALKNPVIILTGGEPMERPDIYELIREGRELGLRMVMATCGYLIDDDSMARLKKAGVEALSFSLDGAEPKSHDIFRQTEGAFDATVKAAQTAKQSDVPFQINTTISKINVDEIVGIAELAKRLGAYCFNPFILVPTGRGAEIANTILDPIEYERLLNELLNVKLRSQIQVRVTCGPQFARICRQAESKGLTVSANGCMGGREFGFISSKGDVQICGFLNIPAGNLIESNFDFAKVWLQSEFLEQIRNIQDYKDNCGNCAYVGICGGCRARAFAMSGDYLAADPICNYKPEGKN